MLPFICLGLSVVLCPVPVYIARVGLSEADTLDVMCFVVWALSTITWICYIAPGVVP